MSIVLSHNKVQEQAGLAVMKMAMDVATNQGDSILALDVNAKTMETSVQPFLGALLDIQV